MPRPVSAAMSLPGLAHLWLACLLLAGPGRGQQAGPRGGQQDGEEEIPATTRPVTTRPPAASSTNAAPRFSSRLNSNLHKIIDAVRNRPKISTTRIRYKACAFRCHILDTDYKLRVYFLKKEYIHSCHRCYWLTPKCWREQHWQRCDHREYKARKTG